MVCSSNLRLSEWVGKARTTKLANWRAFGRLSDFYSNFERSEREGAVAIMCGRCCAGSGYEKKGKEK